tara:strand:- start:144 stop:1436 length:1293 start_codon:yes stop_codon:yes gene_type:complete
MKLIKGFRDIFPYSDNVIEDSVLWNFIEKSISSKLENYNFEKIITPIIENKTTFNTGIGNDTDIISKEMYEFLLYKDSQVTNDIIYCLRPEGTASTVRSYLENSLFKRRKINKLYYMGPMFRYERSQKGRYRQFYQVGAEILGSKDIFYEFELISLGVDLIKETGIDDFVVEINSIGDINSLNKLSEEVRNFTNKNKEKIQDSDFEIINKNPLRFLDKAIHKYNFEDIPKSSDFISSDSKLRFDEIINLLDKNNIKFNINHQLVRGLDYYNDLVFEIKSDSLGAQDTILAGGRYDKLVSKFGGPETFCVGFAAGIERLILLSSSDIRKKAYERIDFYVAYQKPDFKEFANEVCSRLRKIGFNVLIEYEFKNFVKQIKSADKMNSKMLITIGEEEMNAKSIKIKDMSSGKEDIIKNKNIEKDIKNISNNEK